MRWSAIIGDGLRGLRASGHVSTDIDPDDLALTVLAALQGGLLLAQVQRDAGPWRPSSIPSLLWPQGIRLAIEISERPMPHHDPGFGERSSGTEGGERDVVIAAVA